MVVFVNAISTRRNQPRDGFGIERRYGDAEFDLEWLQHYARTIEQHGFDITLVPHGTIGLDQYVLASAVLLATERLTVALAIRPNTTAPTVAAQAISTLSLVANGRVFPHIISGGSDNEQRAQGDFLPKPERYERSEEFIEILKRVWSGEGPFSYSGRHLHFEEFGPGLVPFGGRTPPVSIGGSSRYAYQVGGRRADIFALWGEPLTQTRQQIDRINAEAAKAGRDKPIRFWATFRPIIAETELEAWDRAEEAVQRVARTVSTALVRQSTVETTKRLQRIAAQTERHDGGALWTPPAIAGAGGASSLLVGTPESVSDAIVEYVKIGVDIVSLPSLGDLDEAVRTGDEVIPRVRQKLATLGIETPTI